MPRLDQPILITGATGFVGSYILRRLISTGYTKVTAIYRRSSPFDLIPEDIKHRVTWHICDITDKDELSELVKEVEVIIHCAALVSFWPKQYDLMNRINHLAVKDLISIAEGCGVKRLIHLSSVEALGYEDLINNEDSLYDEATAMSRYSITKRRADQEIKSSNLDYTIYHPGFILGGGYWDRAPLNFIKKIYEGMSFYPSGAIGVVDVRDVAEILVTNIDNVATHRQAFILVADNVKHERYFRKIANHLELQTKFKKLDEPLISVAIWSESMKAIFTKVAPLITRETYKISSKDLKFDNKKIRATTGFEFRGVNESIEDLCECFTSTISSQKYGILEI